MSDTGSYEKSVSVGIYRSRNPLLKNGVNSLHIKRLHENWTIGILDTGYWLLVTGCWKKESLAQRFQPVGFPQAYRPEAQALALRVALLLFIKSTEYRVNPVSSIQYPASWSITVAAFLSK